MNPVLLWSAAWLGWHPSGMRFHLDSCSGGGARASLTARLPGCEPLGFEEGALALTERRS